MSTPRATRPAAPLAAEAEIELPGKVVDLFTRRPTGALKEEFDAMYGIDHDLHPFLYSRAAPKKRGPFHGRWRPDYFVKISDELRRAFPTVFLHHQECFGDRFDDAAAFAARLALYASKSIDHPDIHVDEAIEACVYVLPDLRKLAVRGKTAKRRAQPTVDGIESKLHVYGNTLRPSGQRVGESRMDKAVPGDAQLCVKAAAARGVSEHQQEMILSAVRILDTFCHEVRCLPLDHHLIDELVVTVAPTPPEVTPPSDDHVAVDSAQAALVLGKSVGHISWLHRRERLSGAVRGGQLIVSLPKVEVAKQVRAVLPAYLPESIYGRDQISLPELSWAITRGMPGESEQTRIVIELWPAAGLRPAEWAGVTERDWEELSPGAFAHPAAWSGGGDLAPAVAVLHVWRRYKPYNGGYGLLKNGVRRDIWFAEAGAAKMRRLFVISREMREIARAAGIAWIDVRTLPISRDLPEELWPADPLGPPCLPLFCGSDGRPGDIERLNNAFSRALLVSGFPLDRAVVLGQLMKLRHLAGSLFFEALGGEREAIEGTAAFLGDTVDVVRRTYVRHNRFRQAEVAMRVAREVDSQVEQLEVAASGDLTELTEHLSAAKAAADHEDLEAVRLHHRLGTECITRVLLAVPPEKRSDRLRDGLRTAERTFAEAEAYAQRGRPGWTGMSL